VFLGFTPHVLEKLASGKSWFNLMRPFDVPPSAKAEARLRGVTSQLY